MSDDLSGDEKLTEGVAPPQRLRPIYGILGGVLAGIGLGIIVLFGLNLWNPFGGGTPRGAGFSLREGVAAPEFALSDLSGNSVSLQDFRGKTVLLNFWATWCAPCRVEMPAIQSRSEKFATDLEVLAINYDEPVKNVTDFANELGLTFDVLLDPGGKIQQEFQIRGYPTSVFVDQDGIIQIVHIGVMSDSQLDGYLKKMGLGS